MKIRIISAITVMALAMSLVLSGCGRDTRYIMKVDGEDVAVGLYIMNQFSAAREAQELFNGYYPDADTAAKDFNYNAYILDGVRYYEWVNNRALELTSRMYVINSIFEERGLSIPKSDLPAIMEGINNSWDTDYRLEQLYQILGEQGLQYGQPGGETWGEFFTDAGVSKESFTEYQLSDVKMSKVFESYYGDDGTNPVPDEEWLKVFESDYVRYRSITFTKNDAEGNPFPDDEVQRVKTFAEKSLNDVKNGGKFSDVKIAYESFKGGIDLDLNGDSGTATTPATTAPAPVTDAAATTPPEDNDNETPVSTNGNEYNSDYEDDYDENADPPPSNNGEDGTFDPFKDVDNSLDEYMKIVDFSSSEIMQFILKMETDVPQLYENEAGISLIVRLDVLGNPEAYANYKSSVVSTMKSQEFSDMLDNLAKKWLDKKITVNKKSFEKYDPKKFIDLLFSGLTLG